MLYPALEPSLYSKLSKLWGQPSQTLQVGLVYSPNDEFRSFPEKLPEGANGVLYVIVEPAPFQP